MAKPKTKKCLVAIKHNGEYYIRRKFGENKKFQFVEIQYDCQQKFKNNNFELRQEIVKQIQEGTSFRNTIYDKRRSESAVSLRRSCFDRHLKYAIFLSNEMNEKSKDINVPYNKKLNEQCDENTKKVLHDIKIRALLAPLLVYLLYAISFILLCILRVANQQKLELTSFLFAILLPFVKHLTQIVLRIPMKTCAKFWSCLLKSEFRQLIPMLAFLLAVGILAPTYPLLASYNFPLSEIGIVLIFIDAIVDLFQSDL
ncbi:hypothetical protein [Neglectibacter caecimuris]|uniref:hypothetical protein n=1 Tax=Neglectibacter caecimuris TaxID=3093658 RepID=UPI002AC8AEDF|nr:hypothetical protein [Neglectibacter sp. M00184]